MSINEEIKREKSKLKDKSLKEKLGYIWYYYKIHILAVLAAVVIIGYLISSIHRNSIPSAIYAVVLNTEDAYADHDDFMNSFCKYAGIDTDSHTTTLESSLHIDREAADNNSILANQKLMALFSTKTIDVFISDQSNFDNFAEVGTFYDLREILPKDLQDKVKDNFYYYTYEESGKVPIGIYVNDFPKFKEEGFVSNDAIFGIPATTTQKENAVKFLEYLLQ